MSTARVRRLAAGLPGAWEDFPWGPDECVLKVGPKAFAFLGISRAATSVVVKVEPEYGQALRGSHPELITLPPYLSKRHWISVRLDGGLPDVLVADLVRDSYDLVVAGLTRAQRAALPAPAAPPELRTTPTRTSRRR